MTRLYRPRFYKLVHGDAIQCESIYEFTAWAVEHGREIARTRIGDAVVSTIFLGFDHNGRTGHGPPILFETMIFGTKHDREMVRTATLAQAREAHARLVDFVRAYRLSPNKANGGIATASKLTPEQRKAKARNAALARWKKGTKHL